MITCLSFSNHIPEAVPCSFLKILAFEGNSEVIWFAGNYADYEQDKKHRMGADAINPHRIKYKKLES